MINVTSKAGELSPPKIQFGPPGRYSIAPVYTRFDNHDTLDENGNPEVIRQFDHEYDAMSFMAIFARRS